MHVKTIDIQAKEWFDRINGNSYFSAEVTVNYQMSDERRFVLPFRYGYGSAYESAAFELLKKEFGLPGNSYDLRKTGIIARTSKQENCRKKDLFNPTVKEMDRAKKKGFSFYPYFDLKKYENLQK